jgi:hypothetical protein
MVALGSLILYVLGRELSAYRPVFDAWDTIFTAGDMRVYFKSASWIIEGGRLYREVPSEYPLLANIIFAIARYLGDLLHPGFYGFCIVWMSSAWVVYLSAVNAVITRTTKLAALAWLAPAPIYFTLYRFDIYPAAATLIALFAIKRSAYFQGAAWLGLAIALKGYALFLLPAYLIFIFYRQGLAAAIKGGALAVSPLIVSLLATVVFAGWEGMVAPFKFQAIRTLNGESTFYAINYLFNYLFGASVFSMGILTRCIAWFLQIGFAFAAAAMRPRTFEELVNALLLAALGSMSFSVFYSPQYVLWILPLVCFSDCWIILVSAVLFSWLTYFYCPIGCNVGGRGDRFFRMTIIAVSSLRLFMIFLVCRVYATSERHKRGYIRQ